MKKKYQLNNKGGCQFDEGKQVVVGDRGGVFWICEILLVTGTGLHISRDVVVDWEELFWSLQYSPVSVKGG